LFKAKQQKTRWMEAEKRQWKTLAKCNPICASGCATQNKCHCSQWKSDVCWKQFKKLF